MDKDLRIKELEENNAQLETYYKHLILLPNFL
jgi:hypothetical protein